MVYNEIADEYIEWTSDGRNYRNAMKYLWNLITKNKITPYSCVEIATSIYIISANTDTYLEYSCSTGSQDRAYVAGIRLSAADNAGAFSIRMMTTGITVSDVSSTTLPAGVIVRLHY